MMDHQIVRPPTLLEVVVDAIREEIYRGTIQPGEPLREMSLCDSLKVSRITVREALRKLHEEGLVDIIPHRGTFVKKLTPELVEEIYNLRALLEPYAVRKALEHGLYTDEDFQELEGLVREMGESEASGKYLRMIKADASFHLLLCKRGGLELVNKILDGLQSVNILFMLNTRLYQSDQYPEELSHNLVLEVVRSRNPNQAEEIVRKHIKDAGQSLVTRMEEKDWQAINVQT